MGIVDVLALPLVVVLVSAMTVLVGCFCGGAQGFEGVDERAGCSVGGAGADWWGEANEEVRGIFRRGNCTSIRSEGIEDVQTLC